MVKVSEVGMKFSRVYLPVVFKQLSPGDLPKP